MIISPVKGLPLTLLLTSTNNLIGALLAQKVGQASCLLFKRSLQDAEMNYFSIERHCLAVIFATQKLRHNLLAHSLSLITKSNPLKHLLRQPTITGRVARSLLQLNECEIIIVTPRGS